MSPIPIRSAAASEVKHEGEARQEQDSPAERLALMNKLDASLARSRGALLMRDLAGIERGTRELAGLAQELRPLRARAGAGREKRANGQPSEGPAAGSETVRQLVRSEACVLQALRLHSALLQRAEHRHRVITNTLAGLSLDYSALLRKRSASILRLDWKRPG